MRRTGLVVVVGLVVVIVLIAIVAWVAPGSAPGAAPEAESPTPAQEPAAAAPKPTGRARVPIPRRSQSATSPDEPASESIADDSDVEPASTVPDDFPATQGAPRNLATALRDALGAVTPELTACLDGWHEAQPDVFVGRVVFAFQLDQRGIAQMDVLDVETVPEGTLDCLGDVLWDEVDWPTSADAIEVTWPIQVSVRDD